MPTSNPYIADAPLAAVWEQGYEDGYQDAEEPHYPPLEQSFVSVYEEGELAGRNDKLSEVTTIPTASVEEKGSSGQAIYDTNNGNKDDTHNDESDQELWHTVGDVGVHVGLHKLFGAVGGLVGLVATVLSIPGDSQLRPLQPDWEDEIDNGGDLYFAACPDQHSLVFDGVTSDGYWVGPSQERYQDAQSDAQVHGDGHALVVLCTGQGECGVVTSGRTP